LFYKGNELQLAPSSIEELIGSLPEDDLLDGSVKMMCRGLILTRQGAEARRWRIEELSRLEHQLQEASNNLKQVVDANTAYKKKSCAQAAELELGRLGWPNWRSWTLRERLIMPD